MRAQGVNWVSVQGAGLAPLMIAAEESPELLNGRVRGNSQKKKKLVVQSLKGHFNQVQNLETEIGRRSPAAVPQSRPPARVSGFQQ